MDRLLIQRQTRLFASSAPGILVEDEATEQADNYLDSMQGGPASPIAPLKTFSGGSSGSWLAEFGSFGSLLSEGLTLQTPDPSMPGGCCAAEARTRGDAGAADSDWGSVESNSSRRPSTPPLRRGLLLNQQPGSGVMLPEEIVDPLHGSFVPENMHIRRWSAEWHADSESTGARVERAGAVHPLQRQV